MLQSDGYEAYAAYERAQPKVAWVGCWAHAQRKFDVRELVQRIDAYVKHHNHHAGPFQWTATADSIFRKIERLSKVTSGTPREASLQWQLQNSPAPRQRYLSEWTDARRVSIAMATG